MNAADLTDLACGWGGMHCHLYRRAALPLYPSLFLLYYRCVYPRFKRKSSGIMQKSAVYPYSIFYDRIFGYILRVRFIDKLDRNDIFDLHQKLIQQIGGIFIVLIGLIDDRAWYFSLSGLWQRKRCNLESKSTGCVRSILRRYDICSGLDAMCWTKEILQLYSCLARRILKGALLYTTAYTLGFAVPFFVMAFFIGKVKWIVTYANVMMKIGGGMMIVTGILLYTNQMTKITAFFIRLFGGSTGF